MDFLLEKKLKEGSLDLHIRTVGSILVLQTMLTKYLTRFPGFTDHSTLHSMTVLDYCNRIIGKDQIERLNPEECYVLIMACYLHDIGMGISDIDYVRFSRQLDFGNYFDTHDKNDEAGIVRAFHNEYSGLFIRRYAKLFDIPSEELTRAIIQVARGHRKTDLLDPAEFGDIHTGEAVIRTAYLAAVLRLADEIDVASDRNPALLFDTVHLTEEQEIIEFGMHESITRVELDDETITLYARPKSPEFRPRIRKLADKIRETLQCCTEAAEKMSDLRISQSKVVILEE